MIMALKSNESIKEDRFIKKIVKKKKTKKKVKRKRRVENIDLKNENNLNKILELNNINKNEKNRKKYSMQVTQNIEENTINKLNEKSLGFIDVNDLFIKAFAEQKDFELNSLDYEEAIKVDHRTYFQYYISLLKYNHPIMFSFSPYNDYNSRIKKYFYFSSHLV